MREGLRLYDPEQRLPYPQAWYQTSQERSQAKSHSQQTKSLYKEPAYARTEENIWDKNWLHDMTYYCIKNWIYGRKLGKINGQSVDFEEKKIQQHKLDSVIIWNTVVMILHKSNKHCIP